MLSVQTIPTFASHQFATLQMIKKFPEAPGKILALQKFASHSQEILQNFCGILSCWSVTDLHQSRATP
jgi:hypothetical protein